MLSTGSDLSRETHKMMKDENFSRLLFKESSVANPSFRVYYGVASGSVPFMWESQPGTPKHAMSSCASLLPPLTPPPSYFSTTRSKSKSKSNLINSIIPKLNWRTPKNIQTPPPSSSSMISFSSSSTWSSSSSFSPMSSHRRRPTSSRLSFSSEYDSDDGSPASTLCFGMRHGSGGGVRGCYSMKNALMSIVGQRSSHGTAMRS